MARIITVNRGRHAIIHPGPAARWAEVTGWEFKLDSSPIYHAVPSSTGLPNLRFCFCSLNLNQDTPEEDSGWHVEFCVYPPTEHAWKIDGDRPYLFVFAEYQKPDGGWLFLDGIEGIAGQQLHGNHNGSDMTWDWGVINAHGKVTLVAQ